MRHLPTIPVLLGAIALAGCNKDEIVWVAFNAEKDQTLVVEVAPDCASGDPAVLMLLSSLGRTDVGSAAVDPGCGPVGTNHLVTVDVYDEFEAIVGRVSVDVQTDAVEDLDGDDEPDNRGEGEYDLAQDSADPGAWAITMASLGTEGERREDRFTFHLWQPDALSPDPDTTE